MSPQGKISIKNISLTSSAILILAFFIGMMPHGVLAATDFTITTPTTAIGAGTPSRAITLTVTGGSVGSTTASFALTDGGAGGVFFPSSPVTIGANASVGTTTQFVYTAPANATGTITLQAVATGGILATHTLSLPIGSSSIFAQDNFSGASGTPLLGSTATIGGVWTQSFLTTYIDSVVTQDGSGHVYVSSSPGGANDAAYYGLPATPTTNEQDVQCMIVGYDDTHNSPGCFVDWNSGSAGNLSGYQIYRGAGSGWEVGWATNDSTSGGLGSAAATPAAPTGGATSTLQLSIRLINGIQYIFPYVNNTLIPGFPLADSHLTTLNDPGILEYNGSNSASTGYLISSFKASNADWFTTASSYSITGATSELPSAVGTYTVTPDGSYTGTITLSDGGNGGVFTPASLTWSGSQVARTFTYSNATPGSYTLTGSASPSLINGTLGIQIRTGTTYYVAAGGSDSNNGTSPSTPWQTIAKINAYTFIPGDSVLFNGGDTFSGTLKLSLVGTAQAPITIGSYGTGDGIISSGVGDGIDLTNSQYYTITGLTITGSGWIGTEPSITVLNSGNGIYSVVTSTTGSALDDSNIKNNIISGYQVGVSFDSTASASLVGFQNLNIIGNTLSNNLTGGLLVQGYHADAGGGQTQIQNLDISGNTAVNIPGDPNLATEAWAYNVGSATGVTIDKNYATHIAGYGGLYAGLVYGGSTAIAVTNSNNVEISGNEIGYTDDVSTTHFDGSAIDLDQYTTNAEVADNLTYFNEGPSVQLGSFGGLTTSNIRIHHNISYDDAIGNASGIMQQGAIRFWGNTNDVWTFNNTIVLPCSGVQGQPAGVNFEVGNNTDLTFSNNIFKTCNGYPVFWSATNQNVTNMGNQTIVNNLYDASGGALLISNNSGSTSTTVSTLAAWQADGYENLSGTSYGLAGPANLLDINGFSPPNDGFLNNGGLSQVDNFDLASDSLAIGAGIDPALVGTTLGTSDFHGNPASSNMSIDMGAVAYISIPTSTPLAAPAPVVSVASGYGVPYIPNVTTSTMAVSSSTTTISTSTLESELDALLVELSSLQAKAGSVFSSYVFPRSLYYGMSGSDVAELQSFLIQQNTGPAAAKLSRHGKTNIFGTLTYEALIEFQKKNRIIPASGYFGPITRQWVSAMTCGETCVD